MCASRSDLRIYPVEGQVLAGETLIFCNGIENSSDEAFVGGQTISKIYGNREVFVFHNPTSLRGYMQSYYTGNLLDLREQYALAKKLRELVLSKIQEHENDEEVLDKTAIRIIIFVHSHGARLALSALSSSSIKPQDRERIHIYALGGARLIPKNVAKVARNFFLKGDSVALHEANQNPALEHILDVQERMGKIHGQMSALQKKEQAVVDRTCTELSWKDSTLKGASLEEFRKEPAFNILKKRIEESLASYEVTAREPQLGESSAEGISRTLEIHSLGTYFSEYLEEIRNETVNDQENL